MKKRPTITKQTQINIFLLINTQIRINLKLN